MLERCKKTLLGEEMEYFYRKLPSLFQFENGCDWAGIWAGNQYQKVCMHYSGLHVAQYMCLHLLSGSATRLGNDRLTHLQARDSRRRLHSPGTSTRPSASVKVKFQTLGNVTHRSCVSIVSQTGRGVNSLQYGNCIAQTGWGVNYLQYSNCVITG